MARPGELATTWSAIAKTPGDYSLPVPWQVLFFALAEPWPSARCLLLPIYFPRQVVIQWLAVDDHRLQGLGHRVAVHDEEPGGLVLEQGDLAVTPCDFDDAAGRVASDLDLGLAYEFGLQLRQPGQRARGLVDMSRFP